MSVRVFVDETRTRCVHVAPDGTMHLLLRDEPGLIWKAPIVLGEEHSPAVEYVEKKRALEDAIGDHDTHLSLGALRNRLAWQRAEEEAGR